MLRCPQRYRCALPCHAVLCHHTVPCRIVPCPAVPGHAMSCQVTSPCTMPFHAHCANVPSCASPMGHSPTAEARATWTLLNTLRWFSWCQHKWGPTARKSAWEHGIWRKNPLELCQTHSLNPMLAPDPLRYILEHPSFVPRNNVAVDRSLQHHW